MSVKSAIGMRFEWVICCMFALLLTLGCSRQGIRYAPVAGTITIDGKPIGRAEVVLSCEETTVRPRPTTRGVTDDAGRFVLRSLTPDKQLIKGAVVGRHHVVVTTRILELDARGGTRVVREELLGKEYTKGETLTVDVPPEGIEGLQLDLKAEKRPRGSTGGNAG
jgi:hypothetical protein